MVNTQTLNHLAVIMDGNRRWAKENNKTGLQGHLAGYEKLKLFGDWCLAKKISVLTVFAFSTENWKRTKEEVGYLMDLFVYGLTKDLDYFINRQVQLRISGSRQGLPEKIIKVIDNACEKTQKNTRGILNICFNYGGQTEIIDSLKKIIGQGYKNEQITEELIKQNLYQPDLPFPDIIVRTSGEQRLSGFLLWQSAYSELMFLNKHWPDINEKDLDLIIDTFNKRDRRFGGNSKK